MGGFDKVEYCRKYVLQESGIRELYGFHVGFMLHNRPVGLTWSHEQTPLSKTEHGLTYLDRLSNLSIFTMNLYA